MLIKVTKVCLYKPTQFKYEKPGRVGTAALASHLPKKSIKSLGSHDDDGNKTPQICILDNENSIFARFARAFFIF